MTREILEVDVLIVGGGPAGLSAAIRLSQLVKARGGEPLSIAVLEKARDAGAHLLSGAVLDLSALRDLLPEYTALGAPLLAPVGRERVYSSPSTVRSGPRSFRRRSPTTATRSSRSTSSAAGSPSRPKRPAWTSSPALPGRRCCSTATA